PWPSGICHSTGSRTLAVPLLCRRLFLEAQAEPSAPSRGARIVLVLFHVRMHRLSRPCRGALLDAWMLDRILLPFPFRHCYSPISWRHSDETGVPQTARIGRVNAGLLAFC